MKRTRLSRKGTKSVDKKRLRSDGWEDYNEFMNMSRKEFNAYKSSGDVEKLAQSGEKLWNAFNLMMEKKSEHKIRSYPAMKDAVSKKYGQTGSELLLRTFNKAYGLHVFFYRGYTDDIRDIENNYNEVYEGMTILEKSL